MATYADVDDYRDQTGDATTGDADVERALVNAERDVDRAVGFRVQTEDAARKFDPPTMLARDVESLRRATVAQARYRVVMGDDFFIRDQHEEVGGPEFRTVGKLARISPACFDELSNGGLLVLSTSWKGNGGAPPWDSFARNVEV